MQIAAETMKSKSPPGVALSEFFVTVQQSPFSQYRVIRGNGALPGFDPSEIPVPVTKVYLSVDGVQGAASADLVLKVINDGVRPDPEILYQDLLSGRPGKGFSSSGFAPAVE